MLRFRDKRLEMATTVAIIVTIIVLFLFLYRPAYRDCRDQGHGVQFCLALIL